VRAGAAPLAARAVNTPVYTRAVDAADLKGGAFAPSLARAQDTSLARAQDALKRSASLTRTRTTSTPRDARLDVAALVDDALYVDFSGSRGRW
jgi:hypothetical protein